MEDDDNYFTGVLNAEDSNEERDGAHKITSPQLIQVAELQVGRSGLHLCVLEYSDDEDGGLLKRQKISEDRFEVKYQVRQEKAPSTENAFVIRVDAQTVLEDEGSIELQAKV